MSNLKYIEKIKPFIHLWNTDDKLWLEKRKKDWSALVNNSFYSNSSEKEKQKYKNFFLFGELTEYISCDSLYALVPISSPEISAQYFFSDILDVNERERLFADYDLCIRNLEGVSWSRRHSKFHRLGVLGKEYKSVIFNGQNGKEIQFDPSFFCNSYLARLHVAVTKEKIYNKHGYEILKDWLKYFVSSLKFANDQSYLNDKDIVEKIYFNLKDEVSCLIEDDPSIESLSEYIEMYSSHIKPSKLAWLKLLHSLEKNETKIKSNWYCNRTLKHEN